jgi:hypothetical protein
MTSNQACLYYLTRDEESDLHLETAEIPNPEDNKERHQRNSQANIFTNIQTGAIKARFHHECISVTQYLVEKEKVDPIATILHRH